MLCRAPPDSERRKGHGGRDVAAQAVLRRLRDVIHVRKLVVALVDARRAAEVVDREGREPALAEPQAELLVEPVEAPHVREDDDPGSSRHLRRREERGEPVPVGRLEHEIVVRDGRAGDAGDRGRGVGLVAHAVTIVRDWTACGPRRARPWSPAVESSDATGAARRSTGAPIRRCRHRRAAMLRATRRRERPRPRRPRRRHDAEAIREAGDRRRRAGSRWRARRRGSR